MNYKNFFRRTVSMITMIVLLLNSQYAYAVPGIGGVNGTTVNYDELAETPILAMPGLTINSDKQFDQNSYIEYWIDGATTEEHLGLAEVANVGAISTVNGTISVYQGIVFKGNGVSYDAIANVDSIFNGQNGSKLRIIFERALPNANFLEGTPGVNFSTDQLTGWTILHGTFNLTDAGLNSRSLSRPYDSIDATGSPVVITGPGGAYTYTTNFNYSAGFINHFGNDEHAWRHESREAPSGSLTTTVQIDTSNGGTGGRSLALYSTGSVTSNPSQPNSIYGSHFGPVVVSDPFLATAGENISLDWKAQFVQDHYEVYGFIVETKGTVDILDDVYYPIFYSRGENQEWTTASGTIPNSGEYKFMFVNGTYDKTGGLAVGSRLWIDNIKVYGSKYDPQVAQDISVLVTYMNTSKDPDDTRILNIKVVDEDGEGHAVTDFSTINITNQFSHPPILITTSLNPSYNNGITSSGILFSSTNASTIEAADRFIELTLTVSGLLDGNNEIICIDNEDISLIDNATGTTTNNSVEYVVDILADTATIVLTHVGLTDAQMNALVNGLAYKNNLPIPSIGERIVTLTNAKDNGSIDIGVNGANETVLAVASTVRVSNVILDLANTARAVTTADFTWTEPIGATALQLQQSTDGGTTWTNSTHPLLAVDASSGTVTGLNGAQAYKFRLVVTGGDNLGVSNEVDVETVSNNTQVTSSSFTVSTGQTVNEDIFAVPDGMMKADFLADLTKGNVAQTWNDTQLSNPIAVGDQLVVTAANGLTVTTYTVRSLKLMSLEVDSKSSSSVMLKWPKIIGATDLEAEISNDNGVTWNNWAGNPLALESTSANITGLNSGTTYSFRLVITGGDYEGVSNIVTIVTTSSTPVLQSTPEKVIVIVNGQEENAGIVTNSKEDGKDVVTIEVDRTTIDQKIEAVLKEAKSNEQNRIQVPIMNTTSEISRVQLTGDIVKKLEDNSFDISIKRDNVDYIIPAEELTIQSVAKELGVEETALRSIVVEVQIAKVPDAAIKAYEEIAKARGNEIIFPPVEFNIIAKSTNVDGTEKNVAIKRFSSFVGRVMEIPEGVDPNKITTGIVFNSDGTYEHVPTEVFVENDRYYARLSSLTNSTYSILWNPVTVESVEKHWSKVAVNDMASRLVVANIDDFDPEALVTREEFAVYILKALGLYRNSGISLGELSQFGDLKAHSGDLNAIAIALDWGIIKGYPDKTFKPQNTITREEAMAMYARAMDITKLTGKEDRLNTFDDSESISAWAMPYVERVVNAKVFNGRTSVTLAPESELTHAEALQAIRNLLIESDLINQ